VVRAEFEEWERELIAECRVARLATTGADGRPDLVPICYADVDGRLFSPVDEKPKRTVRLGRLRNIERDPRVSLLVDRYEDEWTRLAWVRVEGLATVIGAGAAMPGVLEALRDRYPQYQEMALEALPLVQIAVEAISSWRWMG
jgi:PPOX class probable F420-dependent enzyme